MLICGVDEAGRGPLAGPVVAAAVVFPEGFSDSRIKDSKKLSHKQRSLLFNEIKEKCHAWSIVAVGARRIEKLNILEATRLAMRLAVERIHADLVLIDGNQGFPSLLPQKTVVKGDQKHIEISAASILAKVWRDSLMKKLGSRYPGYGLESHAGYPTLAHRQAILQLGPCREHRRTFAGVKEVLQPSNHITATV